jgi:cytochrome b
MTPDTGVRPVRVWDLPTRIFHWTLALTVVAAIATAKIGGNAMVWHMQLGLLALALLAFRLLWGFVGGYWSRFSSFAYSPRSVTAYLRGDTGPDGRHEVGHSPLGALSVFALLAVLVAQVATGLVADDEIATTGPLNNLVSGRVARLASGWHAAWGQYLIIALVLLHVGAVLYYLRARQRNLIAPMWHGDKLLAGDTPASADGTGQRLLALLLFAAGLGLAWWISRLGG